METSVREEFDEIRKLMKETEEIQQKNEVAREKDREERKESERDFNRRMKKLSVLLGNYGNSQGEIAEDFFYRSLEQVKCLGNIQFDELARNLHSRFQGKEGEYDVVLYNGDCVGIVEIKAKLDSQDVEKFLHVDLPKVKTVFPHLKDYKIYAAVAGMAVPAEVQKFAEDQGLFVLTQAQEHLIYANSEGFEAKVF